MMTCHAGIFNTLCTSAFRGQEDDAAGVVYVLIAVPKVRVLIRQLVLLSHYQWRMDGTTRSLQKNTTPFAVGMNLMIKFDT